MLTKKAARNSDGLGFVGSVETFPETSLQRGVCDTGVCDMGVCDTGVCDMGVCDTPLRDYFLTNGFVATPSSVVTRTKYMPLARPETLMRMDE